MKIAINELEHLRQEVKNCHQIIKDLQKKRQWVGLTDEEILRADPRFGKSESDVNPYQILGSARDLEAKLKERNT
jgi:hypothetical protein